jgi:F-type H+-transporting ATPase subunit b
VRSVRLALVVATFAAIATLVAFVGAQEEPGSAEHESAEQASAEHGHGDGEHEGAKINWSYGFLGEKEGVQPDLLYRPKGMPPPFLANITNAVMLFGLLVVFGKKPVAEALKHRKQRIVAGMDEAARMRAEAQSKLTEYEEKLKRLDSEVERIRTEMRDAAEAERRRILSEAKERRERMERDAHLLVEQELKAAHDVLVRETVNGALASAEEILTSRLTDADHDRLTAEYLDNIGKTSSVRAGARP